MRRAAAIEVDAAAEGERLDRCLAEPLGSRAQAQRADRRRPRDGRRRRAAEAPPRRGAASAIEVAPEPRRAPRRRGEDAVPFAIAYEDEHLLVVDKPAGVVVHPARGHRGGTLAQALAGRAAGGEDPARAGIVHRLDRDTSGLLVVAKSEAVHRALQEALAPTRAAARVPRARRGPPAGAHAARSTRRSAATAACARACRPTPTSRARRARTSSSSARCAGYALLRVRSRPAARTRSACTCRRSAIRSRATRSTAARGRCSGLERQFLHAARLAFAHPVTGAPVDVSSPLPPDLAAALARRAEAAAGTV